MNHLLNDIFRNKDPLGRISK
jgi:hypothetical protein